MDEKSGSMQMVSMDLFSAALDRFAAKGDILFLAHIYEMAYGVPTMIDGQKGDGIGAIEAALNKALDNIENGKKAIDGRYIYTPSNDTPGENNVIYDFLMKYDLPESTQIKAVQIMAKQEANVFAIAKLLGEKKFSGNVKPVCEDVLIEFAKIPESPNRTASIYVETIANLRKRPLGEMVEKACDDAMKKAIERWGEGGRTELITDFIAKYPWVSDDVKNAAAKALKKLENISNVDFIKDLDFIAEHGQIPVLVQAHGEAQSGETKKLIENAIIKAMGVALSYGWEQTGMDAACCVYYSWKYAGLLNQIAGSDCSDAVKSKAKELQKNWGHEIREHIPDKAKEDALPDHPELPISIRKINLYLLQERRRLGGDGILSQGTVPAPAKPGRRDGEGPGKKITR